MSNQIADKFKRLINEIYLEINYYFDNDEELEFYNENGDLTYTTILNYIKNCK